MDRTEIADCFGLTVETVSRSIGKLKKRSVISLIESDEVIVLTMLFWVSRQKRRRRVAKRNRIAAVTP